MNPNLFVYGTLRSDAQSDMSSYLNPRAEFVGAGKIEGRLYRVSWYPAAVKATGSHVVGDVFRLRNPEETLKRLDEYEDAPNLYIREEVVVEMDSGNKLMAWVYFFNQPVNDYPEIASGDFLNQ